VEVESWIGSFVNKAVLPSAWTYDVRRTPVILSAQRKSAGIISFLGDEKFFRHHYIPRVFYSYSNEDAQISSGAAGSGKTSSLASRVECTNVLKGECTQTLYDVSVECNSGRVKDASRDCKTGGVAMETASPLRQATGPRTCTFMASCPGMFQQAGTAQVLVPKFGFAVESGKGMLSFSSKLGEVSAKTAERFEDSFQPI